MEAGTITLEKNAALSSKAEKVLNTLSKSKIPIPLPGVNTCTIENICVWGLEDRYNCILNSVFRAKTLETAQMFIVQFSSVADSCPTLWDPMDCSAPGLPVHQQLPEFTRTHVYWVGDAIQPSYPLSSPSPPTFSLSQDQGLFKWVSSSHHVAKLLEFQLQHQSYQWTPRTDLLFF